ncbi:MAG: iron ABC transporter permease [Thermofilaceae archaeon]
MKSIGFVSISRLIILAYVLLFILYPIAYLTIYVITPRSFSEVVSFLTSELFLTSFRNSFFVSVITVMLTFLVGLPYAYFLHRYRIPLKRIIVPLTFLPTMIPPFVGALSFIFLLGRFGTINLMLLDAGLVDRPINFLYGLHGIILVQTVALFPWVAINIYNNLLKIDRTLEEAAESLGARPLERFLAVTLPMITPGMITGFFLVFSFSFTDYATPIVIGRYDLLAPQAFTNIQQAIDESRVRAGTYMVFAMLLVVVVIFLAARKYISLKEYASLRLPKPVEEIEPRGFRRAVIYAFIYITLIVALVPHAFTFIISLSKAWSFTPLPTTWTIDNFSVIFRNATPFINTAVYAAVGTILCFLIGSVAAYVTTRTSNPLNTVIDSALSVMYVVPGIVVGTSFLFAFQKSIPVVGVLGTTPLIMPLMLATRRITYTLRYSYATYLTLRKSMEEAAYVLGQRPLGVFVKIVLPNAIYGVLAGTLFSFIEIINELTASLFLYKPGWETITIQIFVEITAGKLPEAAAYAVILLMSSAVLSVVALNLVGRKRSGEAQL